MHTMNAGAIFLVLVALIIIGFWAALISSHFDKSEKLAVACRIAMYVGFFGLFVFVWVQRKGPVWLIMAVAVLGWLGVFLYLVYPRGFSAGSRRPPNFDVHFHQLQLRSRLDQQRG